MSIKYYAVLPVLAAALVSAPIQAQAPPGVFSLNGTSAFYNGGNVGIGTNTPTLRLAIVGGQDWTSNHWVGSVELANASAIGWQANSAGVSFGMGHTDGGFALFHTVSALGTTTAPAHGDFFMTDAGNIGIGTTSPTSKLEIAAQDGLAIDGFQPFITLRDTSNGNKSGFIQSANGDITLLTNSRAALTVKNLTGNVGIGAPNPQSKLTIVGQDALTLSGFQPFLRLRDANAGVDTFIQSVNGILFMNAAKTKVRVLEIIGGADLAEPFQMKEEELETGSVVVIDSEHPGRLKRSRGAYDRRVAGIISGANGIDPGIALHQEGVVEGGKNVALSGRVYAQADASAGAIEPGDLLTTSDNPGHAMKAVDHARAQGAVIGKAMSALPEGTGMVLVLVSLQ